MAQWDITVPAGSVVDGATGGRTSIAGSRPSDFNGATINSVTFLGTPTVTSDGANGTGGTTDDTWLVRFNIEDAAFNPIYGGTGSDEASICWGRLGDSVASANITAGSATSPAPTTAVATSWDNIHYQTFDTVNMKDDNEHGSWASFTIRVDYTPDTTVNAAGTCTTTGALTADANGQIAHGTATAGANLSAIGSIMPTVWLNSTATLTGATQMTVTAASPTSITFSDPAGAPTGSLQLGVTNENAGGGEANTGWIAVTVNQGGAAAGTITASATLAGVGKSRSSGTATTLAALTSNGVITASGTCTALGLQGTSAVHLAAGTVAVSGAVTAGGGTLFSSGVIAYIGQLIAGGGVIALASGTCTTTGSCSAVGANLSRGTATVLGDQIGFITHRASGASTAAGSLTAIGFQTTRFAVGTIWNSPNPRRVAIQGDGNTYLSRQSGTFGNWGSGELTLEVRFEMNSTGATQWLAGKSPSSGSTEGYGIWLNSSNQLVFRFFASSFVYTGATMESGVHAATMCGSQNPDDVFCYVDGELVHTFSLPSSGTNGTASFTLFGNGNGTELFDGKIDEARLWIGVRTAAQIKKNYLYKLKDQALLIGLWDCVGDPGAAVRTEYDHGNLTNHLQAQASGLTYVAAANLSADQLWDGKHLGFGTTTTLATLAGVMTEVAGTITAAGTITVSAEGAASGTHRGKGTATTLASVAASGISLARGTMTALGLQGTSAVHLASGTVTTTGSLTAGAGTQFATGTATAIGTLSATTAAGVKAATGSVTVVATLAGLATLRVQATMLALGEQSGFGRAIKQAFGTITLIGSLGPQVNGDPYYNLVEILANFENPDGPQDYDEVSHGRPITTWVGGTQILSNRSKFGSYSLEIGAGPARFNAGTYPALGSGPWTLEGWVIFDSLPPLGNSLEPGFTPISLTAGALQAQFQATTNIFQDTFGYRQRLRSDFGVEFNNVPNEPLQTGVWYHWAIERANDDRINVLFDGKVTTSDFGQASDNFATEVPMRIGGELDNGDAAVDGAIDNVRYTKGIARYGQSQGQFYTIPDADFPTFGGLTGPPLTGVVLAKGTMTYEGVASPMLTVVYTKYTPRRAFGTAILDTSLNATGIKAQNLSSATISVAGQMRGLLRFFASDQFRFAFGTSLYRGLLQGHAPLKGKVTCKQAKGTITLIGECIVNGAAEKPAGIMRVFPQLDATGMYVRKGNFAEIYASLAASGIKIQESTAFGMLSDNPWLQIGAFAGPGTINGKKTLIINESYGAATIYSNGEGGFFTIQGGAGERNAFGVMLMDATLDAIGGRNAERFAQASINVAGQLATSGTIKSFAQGTITVKGALAAPASKQYESGIITVPGLLSAAGLQNFSPTIYVGASPTIAAQGIVEEVGLNPFGRQETSVWASTYLWVEFGASQATIWAEGEWWSLLKTLNPDLYDSTVDGKIKLFELNTRPDAFLVRRITETDSESDPINYGATTDISGIWNNYPSGILRTVLLSDGPNGTDSDGIFDNSNNSDVWDSLFSNGIKYGYRTHTFAEATDPPGGGFPPPTDNEWCERVMTLKFGFRKAGYQDYFIQYRVKSRAEATAIGGTGGAGP